MKWQLFLVVILSCSASTAFGQYYLMGETNTSASAGTESIIYRYETFSDLLANTSSSSSFTQIDWSPTYHTAGLIFDGRYRLMGETDTSASAGTESFIYTYDTFSDLLANQASGVSATQIDWISTYHTASLVFDGKYRLMGETDTSASAGTESVIYTYDTFSDLLANQASSVSATQINWSSNYHTASLTYNGKYRLMGETDTSASAGTESFIYTYDTFSDLLANQSSSFSATQFDWDSTYNTVSLTVPEPGSMTSVGLLALGMMALRRKKLFSRRR